MSMISESTTRVCELITMLAGIKDNTVSYEDAMKIARFYYDFQNTNALIDEAERMAASQIDTLAEEAEALKTVTAEFLDKIPAIVRDIDYKAIADNETRKYHSRFQIAADELNPYWKAYCKYNNRLDYLHLDSEEYREVERQADEAKAEHDRRQAHVKAHYESYEKILRESVGLYSFSPDYLIILVSRLNSIASGIISDVNRIKKVQS